MPPRRQGSVSRAGQARRRRGAAPTGPWWMQEGQQIPGAAPQTYAPPTAPATAGAPYPTYLPTITRGTTGGTGTPGTHSRPAAPQPYHLPPSGLFAEGAGAAEAGRQQQAIPKVVADLFKKWFFPEALGEEEAQFPLPVTQEAQAAALQAAAGGGGRGGGGRGSGGGLYSAPPGVNPGWYAQFQREHGGQTPEEFYGQTGEGLPEALADREWAEGFAQMTGEPPSQYDWEEHWYSTRGYGRPREQSPREYAAWQKARKERRRARMKEKGEQEPRPPTYMPPPIIWR